MKIRDYIDAGTQKLGSQKALAEQLAQFSETLRSARAGKRGLPNDACIKLAQLLDADPLQVIAASELVTEKKPEKRNFWLQYTSAAAKNPCLRDAGAAGSNPVTPTKTPPIMVQKDKSRCTALLP